MFDTPSEKSLSDKPAKESVPVISKMTNVVDRILTEGTWLSGLSWGLLAGSLFVSSPLNLAVCAGGISAQALDIYRGYKR